MSRQRVDRDRQDLGHLPLLDPWWSALGFLGLAQIGQLKEQVLVSSLGVLSRGAQEESPERWGDCGSARLLGKLYRELTGL